MEQFTLDPHTEQETPSAAETKNKQLTKIESIELIAEAVKNIRQQRKNYYRIGGLHKQGISSETTEAATLSAENDRLEDILTTLPDEIVHSAKKILAEERKAGTALKTQLFNERYDAHENEQSVINSESRRKKFQKEKEDVATYFARRKLQKAANTEARSVDEEENEETVTRISSELPPLTVAPLVKNSINSETEKKADQPIRVKVRSRAPMPQYKIEKGMSEQEMKDFETGLSSSQDLKKMIEGSTDLEMLRANKETREESVKELRKMIRYAEDNNYSSTTIMKLVNQLTDEEKAQSTVAGQIDLLTAKKSTPKKGFWSRLIGRNAA